MEKLDLNIKAAILWQLQHLVKNLTNSKFLKAAQTETEKVILKFGRTSNYCDFSEENKFLFLSKTNTLNAYLKAFTSKFLIYKIFHTPKFY